MRGEREAVEEGVGGLEEGGDFAAAEEVGDYQVAILAERGQLEGCETGNGSGRRGRGRGSSGHVGRWPRALLRRALGVCRE